MTTMRWLLWLAAVLPFAAACSTQRYFTPRENLNGTSPGGAPAAVYRLEAPARGEVRVWSGGAFRDDHDDEGQPLDDEAAAETTLVYVGFELENTGTEPLRLLPESITLADVATKDGTLGPLSPASVKGSAEAPPGGRARLDLRFDVGPATMPRQIRSFDVRWVAVAGEHPYEQVTPFAPYSRRYDPYWGSYWGPYWYDPFWRPYGFGYGIGFGYGWHPWYWR